MTDRVETLAQRVDTLLRQHRATKAEVARLTKALQKAEAARDKAMLQAEGAKRDALRDTLAALPIAAADKPALRKAIDTVIAEIDSILMQLHD
jgi:chromosome segregation ATPase